MNIKQLLKQSYSLRRLVFFLKNELPVILLGDEKIIKMKFKEKMGYIPDLRNPKSVNEKLQWLKLYDRKDFNTLAADKYKVREFYKENFGEEYVVPLLCKFDSWKDLTLDSLPDEPFIIKANTGTSTWRIVRDKKDVDIKQLKNQCRGWMHFNHYYASQEWQYKNIKPCLIVEKLLVDSEGKIPVDYKLHFFNGELQFIYCVADREGDAYRAMFSPKWELLPFQWVSTRNHQQIRTQIEEPKPINLEKMITFGSIIAKRFKYVRVDYYEIEGKLFFSEITMHHGSGMNKFYPPEAEHEYAEKLSVLER